LEKPCNQVELWIEKDGEVAEQVAREPLRAIDQTGSISAAAEG